MANQAAPYISLVGYDSAQQGAEPKPKTPRVIVLSSFGNVVVPSFEGVRVEDFSGVHIDDLIPKDAKVNFKNDYVDITPFLAKLEPLKSYLAFKEGRHPCHPSP